MKQHWMEQTYALVDDIRAMPMYQRLLELKRIIQQERELLGLIQQVQSMQTRYDEVRQYGTHHPDLKSVQKRYSLLKYELDSHPLVAEYRSLEKEMQGILDTISKSLATAISAKIKFPNDIGIIPKH